MPKKSGYTDLKAELDSLMLEMQREDLSVDEAVQHYKRGLELLTQLEKHLMTTKNQIIELKASFDNAAIKGSPGKN